MCHVLNVSRSAYYSWLKQKPKTNIHSCIESDVMKIFQKSKATYGSPRVHQSLLESGVVVSKSSVSRVMRQLKLKARARRKYVHTTDSAHGYRVFENILNRNFTANTLNQKWLSDITYIPTKQGWTYLTVIIDLADKMIVSWSLSQDMSTENTSRRCLEIALLKRSPKSKLIFHSDRGVQYCSELFRQIVNKHNYIIQSMSRKGNCWDNAPCESFFKTLKSECTNQLSFNNINEVQTAVFDYIERWYNTRRKHSSIDYMTPLQKHNFLSQTVA